MLQIYIGQNFKSGNEQDRNQPKIFEKKTVLVYHGTYLLFTYSKEICIYTFSNCQLRKGSMY